MKNLVCADDITQCYEQGSDTLYVEEKTIVTSLAEDIAEEFGIRIKVRKPKPKSTADVLSSSLGNNLTTDQLVLLLKKLLANEQIFSLLPFEAECHANGLKVVKGSSVKMVQFDTGNPQNQVTFQELVNKDESHMSAGFLEIDHSSFEWELSYEEIDYVIEGTLTVTLDGKTYTANAGDVLFVPKDTKVIWGSPDKARVFYATYPANWADLM
ncbi:cupin domain-containing protein [Vagococcus humatus]|uniref:Ethanolamine utilization protein EutQ n=1 Tax=Vagococcus humatus TaxID=1889241 RepID=A0A3R9ZVL0_9ENTE|nr:cupin domain-containing protein [Vagococcus humatus]RST88766.1 ethanolamine utilization protein EutQ [Vagococcus humatus]